MSYKFCRIDASRREFCQYIARIEEFLCYLFHVVDFSYSNDGKASQVGIHQQRLSIGIAYDANTFFAKELWQVVLKACAEVCILKIVNRTFKASSFYTICCYTATLGAKV